MLPKVAGRTGVGYITKLFFLLRVIPGCPETMILLIAASKLTWNDRCTLWHCTQLLVEMRCKVLPRLELNHYPP
jgi:hypothetical protein